MPPPAWPAFLVATSAGEVGIDLDADHLVCDLVAAERMIQRLGRVNRRGGEGRVAMVEVVSVPPEPPKDGAKEDVKEKYKDDCDRVAAWKAVLLALMPGEDGRHDASPAAIADLKEKHGVLFAPPAITPAPLHPRLDRAVVEAWAMTSLIEHPGRPEPAPWLRGWVEDDSSGGAGCRGATAKTGPTGTRSRRSSRPRHRMPARCWRPSPAWCATP